MTIMDKDDSSIPEPKKRAFLKGASLSIAALLAGGASFGRYTLPSDRGIPVMSNYPLAILEDPEGNPITVGDIEQYAVSSDATQANILVFDYPLQNEPTLLIAIKGVKITTPKDAIIPTTGFSPIPPSKDAPMDGIIYDPYNDISIIALSGICQHLGCVPPFLDYHPGNSIPFEAELVGYKKDGKGIFEWPKFGLVYCKCHGSQYNPVWGGSNLYNNGAASSPANHSLPQIMLATNNSPISNKEAFLNSNIFAYGINSKNAVIRTHLQYPGGETYGPEVKKENLTGGTPIRTSSRFPSPKIYTYGDNASNIKSGSPADFDVDSSNNSIILYKTVVVSNSGPWKGNFNRIS